jgi:diguanylate cyclase (GGDEF)-like protein
MAEQTFPSYDPLTRALTRPSFLSVLDGRARQADESGETFAVCLVDVDRLKNVNDERGLHVGDQMLAALAQRLRATLEQPGWSSMEHTLARYDGDALIVLVQPCNASQGERVAEALRFHVAEAPLHDGVSITVSIAIAVYRIGESVDALLARTEKALHVAKQFGRDRVEVSRSPESRPTRAKARKIRE